MDTFVLVRFFVVVIVCDSFHEPRHIDKYIPFTHIMINAGSVLSFEGKTTQHWFTYFQITGQ